jgi:hypothetical protein
MSFNVDEFLHNTKLAAHQQQGDYAPFVYGHIANYDPATHRVRCVLPSIRNEDDTPALTGWMPLGSGMAGQGWGIQMAPLGGATIENPTKGELVIIQRVDRQVGVTAVASMVFNQVNTPPGPSIKPGEMVISSSFGSSLKFDAENNITITSSGKVTVDAQGDVTLMTAGNLILQAASSKVSAAGGTLHKLVTDVFQSLFNTHTHPGNNQPPTQQMDNTNLTSTLTAE